MAQNEATALANGAKVTESGYLDDFFSRAKIQKNIAYWRTGPATLKRNGLFTSGGLVRFFQSRSNRPCCSVCKDFDFLEALYDDGHFNGIWKAHDSCTFREPDSYTYECNVNIPNKESLTILGSFTLIKGLQLNYPSNLSS